MIGYIKGEAIVGDDNTVVMECGGMGYEVVVSNTTVSQILSGSPYICLQTYLKVSEDGVVLYGFYTKEERQMFLNLITVNGISIVHPLVGGIRIGHGGGYKQHRIMAFAQNDVRAVFKDFNIGLNKDINFLISVRGAAGRTDIHMKGHHLLVMGGIGEFHGGYAL